MRYLCRIQEYRRQNICRRENGHEKKNNFSVLYTIVYLSPLSVKLRFLLALRNAITVNQKSVN